MNGAKIKVPFSEGLITNWEKENLFSVIRAKSGAQETPFCQNLLIHTDRYYNVFNSKDKKRHFLEFPKRHKTQNKWLTPIRRVNSDDTLAGAHHNTPPY